LVLTAAHVVAVAVTLRAVDLGVGYDYPATLIGTDRRHDIALIQLQGAAGLPTAHLADSDTTVQPGELVESIGNAYGRG
jgi:S1-C subfamily serine protease